MARVLNRGFYLENHMTERKLASVQRIAEIKPIPGADAIEAARVNGWWVVVNISQFSVGDLALYLEIDSWVPTELAPFLSKGHSPRVFNGVEGERLRTVKLRGKLSQGLILPLPPGAHAEGDDLTETLGIQKWERPISACLQGICRSTFPSCIPKTDQERIQNIPEVFDDLDIPYQCTVKLDGSSMTVAWIDGEMHVCSRNMDLKLDQENNAFVDTAKRIFSNSVHQDLAIQGELMGPKIQGNRESLSDYRFFVFDIFDIEFQSYWTPDLVYRFCEIHDLEHVPSLGYFKLREFGTMEAVLKAAEGPSLHHAVREGVVFKSVTSPRFSFKAIANNFLLQEKDI
jgi:RNA ligase (TIGR02306 family)